MENEKTIKLILAGLDNAGKTSFLTVLEKIYGFEEIIKYIKPTLGVHYTKRDYFGNTIMYWDFGGQEEFRNKYLRNKQYFTGTNLIYYLIDIQDEDRYDASINYLGEIIKLLNLNDVNSKIPIHICFSKSDYNIISDKSFDYPNKVNMIHRLLTGIYKNINFKFHYTSIYDLMSIISVHVRSMRKIIPLFDELDKLIVDFTRNYPVMRVILADHTGLPFVNYTSENYWLDQLQPKIDKQAGYQLQLLRQIEEIELEIEEVFEKNNPLQTYYFKFKGDRLTENIVSIDSIFEQFFDENNRNNQLTNQDLDIEDEKNKFTANYFLLIYTQNNAEKIKSEIIQNLLLKIKKILSLSRDKSSHNLTKIE